MSTVAVQKKRFGRYEIIRKLGRSMTDVYLAYDERLGRNVILKLVEESQDDFTKLVIEAERRGALIQADLHRIDPRFLEVYECDEADGCFFVSMEYFEGRNIEEILHTERRLEAKRAATYAAETCSQLERLHSFMTDLNGKRCAVVHGDIKPSNIQIGRNDEVRLLDFGIAKVISYTRNLTQHNMGSPTYCSPERLAKGEVDAQSDLWALGVSLYEMVSGCPPYQAQDTRKLENLIQSKRPPRSLPDDCPRALAAIIKKALAADIDRRYPSAVEFESDLRAFIQGRATQATLDKKPAWGGNTTVQKFRPEVVDVQPGTRRVGGGFERDFDRLKNVFGSVRRVNWMRASAILFAVLSIFLAFYLVGRVRDEIWRTRVATDYSRASVAEINADWDSYRKLKQRDSFLGRFSPAVSQGESLRTSFLSAADDLLDDYRNSSDESLSDFDWEKAQVLERYALEIQPNDRKAQGRAALIDGFLNLSRNPNLPKAAASEPDFQKAAKLLPRDPDPHLALARLYVYSYQNIGRAMAELHLAERLGLKLGPREAEEEADGYLLRAESEMRLAAKATDRAGEEESRRLRLAEGDLKRARDFYEPIIGFSNVNENLKRLEDDESRLSKLKEALPVAAPPKPPASNTKKKSSIHWPWR
jgi:serine/threonine protein kinase